MADPLEALTHQLQLLGAPDPEAWARSELEEGIPQTARYAALRRLWPELIHPWRDAEVLRADLLGLDPSGREGADFL